MKVAYIVLAHKNWMQLGMLVQTLKEDWNDIFIHIDGKSSFDESLFRKATNGINVSFVWPRISVYWGHISILYATIALLKLVQSQPKKYQRVVLISGQDFPITDNDSIRKFFLENPTHEYLEFSKLPLHWWAYGGWDRVLVYNFPRILGPFWNRVLRVLQMALPYRRKGLLNQPVYGSSQWFNLTGEAVGYILEQVENTDILKKFNYSYCADEIFFQTILLNSHFSANCINGNLRYMEWLKKESGPKCFCESDLPRLLTRNENLLFARKFDTEIDNGILKTLSNRHRAKKCT